MSKCCKNCIHYDACKKISDVHGLTFGSATFCNHFKAKSLFVELPCEVGDVIHLIDKEFVNKALINELSRMAYENEEKEAKERGFVRVKPNLPKLPRTNFDKITESVESLAEFIDSLNLIDCNACVGKSICDCHIRDCKEVFIKWLQQEIDDV